MTAPAYNTDLQIVSDAETTTGWAELVGHTSGGAPTQEDRAHLQNTACVSQTTGQSTAQTAGLQFDYGSNISWTTGFVFLAWQYWNAPQSIETWANGGMRFGVGSSNQNIKFWNTMGSNYGKYPYGGWQNTAIDPTYSADQTEGSPVAGNYRIFGSLPNITQSVSKGYPHCVDVIRYGRGKIIAEYGDAGNGYCTFAGLATSNDDTANRWGLLQYSFGQYIWKGLMSIGTDTNAVDFRDSNRNIVVDDTPRTYASFNRIEVRNASSYVTCTNIAVTALGTLSKGQFEMVANATLEMTSCQFTGMDTFIFQSNATLTGTTFRRCAKVTGGGAQFTKCVFEESPDSISLSVADLDKINACSFKSDGSNHAVELTSIGDGTMAWSSLTSNYAASDGSTGNEVIYINCTSSQNLAITVIGGASTPTIRKAAGYTGTVTFPTSITLKMVVKDENNQVVSGAYAYIDDNDETPFIMNTTTGGDGVAQVSYTGNTVNGSRWRVRKYGYKQFKQLVDIGTSDVTVFVTLVADSQQS
jgi:hypothetical protein